MLEKERSFSQFLCFGFKARKNDESVYRMRNVREHCLKSDKRLIEGGLKNLSCEAVHFSCKSHNDYTTEGSDTKDGTKQK